MVNISKESRASPASTHKVGGGARSKKASASSSTTTRSSKYIANSRLIHGFRILELFNDGAWSNFPRFIYVKRHFSNDAENADRTVFVTGLPIDLPVADVVETLELCFSRAFGAVQHVKVTMLKDADGHASVRCGHVVFEEEDGVEAALSEAEFGLRDRAGGCLLYTSPSPRDRG